MFRHSTWCGMVLAVVIAVAGHVSAAWAGFGFRPDGGVAMSMTQAPPAGSPAGTLGSVPDTQAGSHPFEFSSTIAVNVAEIEAFNPNFGEPSEFTIAEGGDVKDIEVALPAGLVGDPSATPQCPHNVFDQGRLSFENGQDSCPVDTQVGYAQLLVGNSFEFWFHPEIFNLVPPRGVPAEFGMVILGTPIVFVPSVRTGGDYGFTAKSSDVPQAYSLLSGDITLWGVPADPAHDPYRGACLAKENHEELPESICSESFGDPSVRPFVTLPTSCAGPLKLSARIDSYEAPGVFDGDEVQTPGMTGCEKIAFTPSISVQPEGSGAGSPAGLNVDVHTPQNSNPSGLAEGNLKRAVVTLPAGVVVNPSLANGLDACTPGEIGMDNANPVSCPSASNIGSVEVDTPLLSAPLTGFLYVAQQTANPFGSLLAVYLVAEGSGVLVKSAGEVRLDPTTGQVTTVFDNIPQQPFTDVRLHLDGGSRAALVLPQNCGTYTTESQLTPYSSLLATDASESFQVSSGCQQGFSPSFSAGTTSNQAGGFSPFSITFSRTDQDQYLGGLSVKAPPGLLGLLKTVQLCGEPQASQGTCGAGSLIGHTTATAGAGPDPVSVTGQVFLTGPYKGAPYGLSIVVPAVAGPFDLGTVVVRSAISIDPHTAQITVTSDPLPTMLQGVPLQIKAVNVTVDRGGFMFNPTNCEPLSVDGTIVGTQGASVQVSSRFQAANCAALPFKPVFSVSTQAKTSKRNGASLIVKGVFPAGEANTRSVAVVLPKQLPARLTTIQQACTQAVFAANPASCPAGSNIGTATASTPVLAGPVSGPVYLVSHGGAAFPDVVAILQGEGVTVDLTGSIDIKHGVTSSTFAAIPDAPITTFQLSLPEGPHSGLAAVVPAKAKGSLCGQSLPMPFTITGQNGAVVKQPVKIAVTGCPKTKKKPKAEHTRARGKPKSGKGK